MLKRLAGLRVSGLGFRVFGLGFRPGAERYEASALHSAKDTPLRSCSSDMGAVLRHLSDAPLLATGTWINLFEYSSPRPLTWP